MQLPVDDGADRVDGHDGAAGMAGARPPPKKKAKVPDDPFTRAGYGETFEVKIELDPKEYSQPSLTVRMRRNATTGYPECVDPCPDRKWCTSKDHSTYGWCIRHAKAKAIKNGHMPPKRGVVKLKGGGTKAVRGTSMLDHFSLNSAAADSSAAPAPAPSPVPDASTPVHVHARDPSATPTAPPDAPSASGDTNMDTAEAGAIGADLDDGACPAPSLVPDAAGAPADDTSSPRARDPSSATTTASDARSASGETAADTAEMDGDRNWLQQLIHWLGVVVCVYFLLAWF